MILRIEAENFRSFDKLAYTINGAGLVSVEGYWDQDPMHSNGSGKCLPADTKLKHAITGEYDTIEHWHARVLSGETLYVWGMNSDWKLEPTRVTSVFPTGKKQLLDIEFDDGYILRVSDTHPIFSERGCIQSSSLLVGDMCAGPRRLPVQSAVNYNAAYMVLLGLLLSEGSLTSTSLGFTASEPAYLHVIEDAAASVGLRVTQVGKRDDCHNLRGISPDVPHLRKVFLAECDRLSINLKDWFGRSSSCVMKGRQGPGYTKLMALADATSSIVFRDLSRQWYPAKSFRHWLSTLGVLGVKATRKKLPAILHTLSDDDVRVFLQSYWAGDGYVGTLKNREVSVTTASRDLAEGLRSLLLRFGILTKLRLRHMTYTGSTQRFQSYTLEAIGRSSRIALCTLLSGMPHAMKQMRLGELRKFYSTLPENDNRGLVPSSIVFPGIESASQRTGLAITNRAAGMLRSRAQWQQHNASRAVIARAASYFDDTTLTLMATSDVTWRTIRKITPVSGRHSTFDVSVDNETHLYALDSVITHNSSFLTEVLTWAIFGETTEGQTASEKVRDVVKTGTKACKVTVTLPFMRWTRSQRAGNKSNKVEIDGHEYHKLADAEAHLLQLFPPKKVFSSTLVLGQGIGNRLTGWKPAERTKTLSDLFGLGIFEQAREGVRKLIRGWESSKVGANAKLQTISQQKAQVAAQAGGKLSDAELTKLQHAMADLEQALHYAQDEQKKLADASNAAYVAQSQAANAATSMASLISKLQGQIAGIDMMETCDRCQRKMTKAAKDALTQNMKTELEAHQQAYPTLEAQVTAAQQAYQNAQAAVTKANGETASLTQELSSHQQRLALHNQATQTLGMFEEQELAAQQELATADTEIGYYQKLDEAFGPNGIPLRKMESVISVFNTALARICEGVWESEIFVQLTTERTLKSGSKKNEIDIIVEGANGPTYSACSPGERRRLDLTLQLALREVLLSSWKSMMPLLVCDDVVDVLDARAKIQLYENYLVPLSENNVIFVVSPESTLSRDVPRVYIHRDGTGSKVMLNEATNILKVEDI